MAPFIPRPQADPAPSRVRWIQYNIISDSPVPEPGTLALAALGGGLLLITLKRRHQTNS